MGDHFKNVKTNELHAFQKLKVQKRLLIVYMLVPLENGK